MSKKNVVVMMATYNGLKWISEQVDSILNQQDVNILLLISDDNSSDGTYEWLLKRAEDEQRITVLPRDAMMQKGAAGNFYHLLQLVEVNEDSYYALADQDDIWYPNKLSEQIEILSDKNYAATSSNVNSFWPDGRTHLIKKSQPQRQYDFFFESAGPGCTYCFNADVLKLIQSTLKSRVELSAPNIHDWFIYAVCRVHGQSWFIDSRPHIAYRQHDDNEVGAHHGWSAKFRRLGKIFSGIYRREVSKLATIFRDSHVADIRCICERLLRMNLSDRIFLILNFRKLRRRTSDSFILALLIAFRIY